MFPGDLGAVGDGLGGCAIGTLVTKPTQSLTGLSKKKKSQKTKKQKVEKNHKKPGKEK